MLGYARISTSGQSLDPQLDALKAAGCYQIYQEMASGGRKERPELQACLKALRPGDTLVVWKLDRLGRSLPELVRLATELGERGVVLKSLTENLDFSTPTGKLMFGFFALLADFERDLIRERTMAGLATARERGRKGGRKPKLGPEDKIAVRQAIEGGMSLSQAARLFKVSKSTIHNAANEAPKGMEKETKF
jgi:DNA invertase Pin-like site-specific DNA recombinase